MEGWIKLHRKLIDSKVFANPNILKIWIFFLVKANFKKVFVPVSCGTGITTVTLEKGQFLFGRNKAEKKLKINRNTIYKNMKKMEKDGLISIKSNNHYSIVTICNYEQYQPSDDEQVTAKEQQRNSKVTAKEQQSNSNVTQEKNDKNDNNEKEGEEEGKIPPPDFKADFSKDELNSIINYFRPLILAGFGLSELNNFAMFELLTDVMEIVNNKNNNLTYFITNLYAQNQLFTKEEAIYRGKLTTYTGTRENAFEDGNYMKVNYIDLMIKKDVNYKTKNENLIRMIKEISKSAVSA